jgi:hypothetical protein
MIPGTVLHQQDGLGRLRHHPSEEGYVRCGIETPFLALIKEAPDAVLNEKVGAMLHILLPLLAPGLVASAIFSFTLAWNEFLLALVITMD